MAREFNTLRGITIASALSGTEKQEVLEFINEIERSLKQSETKGLDRKPNKHI